MELQDILQNSITLLTLISGVALLIRTSKQAKREAAKDNLNAEKTKRETTHLDLENARDALSLANESLEQVTILKSSLSKACSEYETEIASLKVEMKTLREEVEDWQGKYEEVKDWAERLVHQVYSLGGDPVPLKPKKKVTKNGT